MSKDLILCEKPSVARDFVGALGGQKRNGFYENDKYYITWGFGHLLAIDDEKSQIQPEWSWSVLPLFPDKFLYKPIDKNCAFQLQTIKSLLAKSNSVIIATDPGREGELIARLILQYCGWNKWNKTYRFWTSEALTKEVITNNIKKLRPAEDFDSLYWCALARMMGDWYVGINLTRACSIQYQKSTDDSKKEVWSVGRVQTPTLYMVYQRMMERKNFKPEEYSVIFGDFKLSKDQSNRGYLVANKEIFKENDKDIDEDTEKKDSDKEFRLHKGLAEKIYNEIKHEKLSTVADIEKKIVREKPPLLHSLTSLQREANQIYKFSAQKTLQLAQQLYEAKLISYPRTDSQFLAESSRNLVVSVLNKIKRDDLVSKVWSNKFIFDDSKLTDHYALIVMNKWSEEHGLTKEHKQIYDLVLRKFLGVFYPDYIYDAYTIFLNIKNYKFKVTGKKIQQLGWKELYNPEQSEINFDVKVGDKVSVNNISHEIRKTTPPPLYSESNILKLMEKNSLGTPATRANILETLKKRYYCFPVQKVKLECTNKGSELINQLKDTKMVSVDITRKWEEELEDIYKKKKGFNGYKNFIDGIKDFVNQNLEIIKRREFKIDKKRVVTHKQKPMIKRR